MADTEEVFISELIQTIIEATEENSVSNGMVGRILEFLNERRKALAQDLDTIKGDGSSGGTGGVSLSEGTVKTIEWTELDLMGLTSTAALRTLVRRGQPLLYAVTKDGYQIGSLTLFSPDGHVVTQVLVSHSSGVGADLLNAHIDGEISICYRVCPMTSTAATLTGVDRYAWGPWIKYGSDPKDIPVWHPDISEDGTLSWTLSTSDISPEMVNVIGPTGATGATGPEPYVVEVFSDTGDKLKNGQGSAQLSARVLRGGEVIEDADTEDKQFTYIWIKYDKDGNLSNWLGTTSSRKTGNPITVTAEEIEEKATFRCTVTG